MKGLFRLVLFVLVAAVALAQTDVQACRLGHRLRGHRHGGQGCGSGCCASQGVCASCPNGQCLAPAAAVSYGAQDITPAVHLPPAPVPPAPPKSPVAPVSTGVPKLEPDLPLTK